MACKKEHFMLSATDTPIDLFIPLFSELEINVAFLVPTENGYSKSIMDATSSVRTLLKLENIHDYEIQMQGQQNKVMIPAHFVYADKTVDSFASLYRPITKKGDPRIWFIDLKNYCSPYNLLALVVMFKEIYVINLSNISIRDSFLSRGDVYQLIYSAKKTVMGIAEELLAKLHDIHAKGYIPSITKGAPGVGDTLENALGISRNNSKLPDYKGIELKTWRSSKEGKKKDNRSTLFTKVPDEGLTYREILKRYGKFQTPKGEDKPRLQLYETFKTTRVNAYDLILELDSKQDKLLIDHVKPDTLKKTFVSAWLMENLRNTLLQKHRETFWIEADAIIRNGEELFRYDRVTHTKKPNVSLLEPLLENGTITVDLAAHIDPDTKKYRDHGVLFKIKHEDIHLLLGTPEFYDL